MLGDCLPISIDKGAESIGLVYGCDRIDESSVDNFVAHFEWLLMHLRSFRAER